MAEPTPYGLSKRFSQLTGRKVAFVVAPTPLDSKVRQLYGIYTVLPHETPIVIKADLALLGSFAGALVGLPDSVVKQRLGTVPMDEVLRDAISEVFNITAAEFVTEGRAVFLKMVADPVYIDGPAGIMMKRPDHRSYFNVTVDGYQGGKFNIFSKFGPVANYFR